MHTPSTERSGGTLHEIREIRLRLDIAELNLVLEAVGHLPFARVYALVGKIQRQAAEQIQAAQAPAELPEQPQP